MNLSVCCNGALSIIRCGGRVVTDVQITDLISKPQCHAPAYSPCPFGPVHTPKPCALPSSQPPQYVPPSSKSNLPPVVMLALDGTSTAAETAAAVSSTTVDQPSPISDSRVCLIVHDCLLFEQPTTYELSQAGADLLLFFSRCKSLPSLCLPFFLLLLLPFP